VEARSDLDLAYAVVEEGEQAAALVEELGLGTWQEAVARSLKDGATGWAGPRHENSFLEVSIGMVVLSILESGCRFRFHQNDVASCLVLLASPRQSMDTLSVGRDIGQEVEAEVEQANGVLEMEDDHFAAATPWAVDRVLTWAQLILEVSWDNGWKSMVW
jgi:hypothetical protein